MHWIGCLNLQLIAPHVYVQKKLEKVEVARMVEIDKDVKEVHVTGPCTKSLDAILKEIGVERQAYHGNTIYGNHCHLLLKDNNIMKLCGTISNVILCEIGEGVEYRNSLVETDNMTPPLRLPFHFQYCKTFGGQCYNSV